jgi:hypothetical protein
MNQTPPKLNDAWQGLEPEQPRPNQSVLYLALATTTFLLVGVCALAYFVWQQRGSDPGEPLLPPATTIAKATTAVEEAAESATATAALAATATLPGSVTSSPPAFTADVIASRLHTPPAIGSFGTQWVGLPVYSSPYVVFTHREWDGSDDLEATWQIAWDDTYLYLLANVTDDLHVQTQTGRTAYLGDSMELQLDTARMSSLRSTLDPNTYQISLSPGDFAAIPPSAWRFQGTADGQMLDAPGADGILIAAQRSQNGYMLEAAIPWLDIDLRPSVGLVLGLAVNFNDNDRPGTAVQEMMKSNAPNRRFGDPATWGTLRLE